MTKLIHGLLSGFGKFWHVCGLISNADVVLILIDGARWNFGAFRQFHFFFGNLPKWVWTFVCSESLHEVIIQFDASRAPRACIITSDLRLVCNRRRLSFHHLIYWIFPDSLGSGARKLFLFTFCVEKFRLLRIFSTNWIHRQLNNMNYRKFWTRSSDNLNETLEASPSIRCCCCCCMMQR